MATMDRRKLRSRLLGLCTRHGIDDDARHVIVSSVTGGRTQSIADARSGREVATAAEIEQAIRWVEDAYGPAKTPAPEPRSDWIPLPQCPIRPGLASAGTLKKILAMARVKLGLHFEQRLEGIVFKNYPRNPIALFHRRRAAAAAGSIGDRLAELPEREACRVIQLLKRSWKEPANACGS